MWCIAYYNNMNNIGVHVQAHVLCTKLISGATVVAIRTNHIGTQQCVYYIYTLFLYC